LVLLEDSSVQIMVVCFIIDSNRIFTMRREKIVNMSQLDSPVECAEVSVFGLRKIPINRLNCLRGNDPCCC
jgi:hypothetical protein